jgi:1-acyl-sn-glycerol-3-phosphate acyltransferase
VSFEGFGVGSSSAVWGRRAVTIPLYLLLTGLALLVLPFALAGALCVDLARGGSFPAARTILFFAYYLACESLGLVASFLVWLAGGVWGGASRERYLTWNFRLQCAWARWLFGGARRIFGFRVEVVGEDSAQRGPLLLFMRHASVADTLLPAVLLSDRVGLRLRYVIKRELLWDPCLDVVGRRLPNVFVRRGSDDAPREVELVRRLARGRAGQEGVLIFPEGTRFTPEKLERAIASLARSRMPYLAERARTFRQVLPPRLGGPLALLEECPRTDVVFCAHIGFEGTTTFRELWEGALVGRRVRVCFWRVPGAEIPTDRVGRIDWLYGEWARVDAWLGEQRREDSAPEEAA